MSRLIDENDIIKMLNTMDRYTSEELTLCDTDKTFPKNEVFIVDDVFEGLDALPSAQPEIIRCGQCKYAEVADKEDAQDGYTCQFHRGSIWFSGSYCSWAERRTDEQ